MSSPIKCWHSWWSQGTRNCYLNLFSQQDIHKELEEKISKFHEREDAILYACCFDANTGLFETLLSPDDAVISDELNHASIIDGIRLCKAKKLKYKNKDMAGTVWGEKNWRVLTVGNNEQPLLSSHANFPYTIKMSKYMWNVHSKE